MKIERVFLRNMIRVNGDMLREVAASEKLLIDEAADRSVVLMFGDSFIKIPEPAVDAIYYRPEPPPLPKDEPPTNPVNKRAKR